MIRFCSKIENWSHLVCPFNRLSWHILQDKLSQSRCFKNICTLAVAGKSLQGIATMTYPEDPPPSSQNNFGGGWSLRNVKQRKASPPWLADEIDNPVERELWSTRGKGVQKLTGFPF
jgi:hypothetical protein